MKVHKPDTKKTFWKKIDTWLFLKGTSILMNPNSLKKIIIPMYFFGLVVLTYFVIQFSYLGLYYSGEYFILTIIFGLIEFTLIKTGLKFRKLQKEGMDMMNDINVDSLIRNTFGSIVKKK